MAQYAADQPFQTPIAPVAGFSPDQLSAFQTTNNAQGMAQPYYQEGAGLVRQGATPDVSQYLNPYTSNVLSGLKDIFGQQQQETTGNLTQAAGGVGADRIAVGQSELARQQGLSAGQTLSNIYAPAVSEALMAGQLQQGAGYGLGQLGAGAQGAQLQGSYAQLGTGGLQQQLSQAQLNAPYTNTLQRLAYPYQNAQFLSGITSGLGPTLGGTTTGQGTTQYQPPAPSIWSQLAGLGTTGLGIYGAGQQQGWWGGGGNSGGGYGGATNVPNSPNASIYSGVPWQAGFGPTYYNGPAVARGGRISPFAAGGVPLGMDPFANEGGPSIVPDMQLQPMPVQHPTLKLNPQQGGGGGSSGGSAAGAMGDIASLAKVAMMFANRGGRTGYADGGSPDDFPNELPPAYHDPSTAPRALASAFAPGLTRYLTEPAPPPQITPNAAGKVPSPYHNPNTVPAMQDVANMGMAAIPFGRAASMAGEFAPFAARAAEVAAPRGAGSTTGLRALGSVAASIPTDVSPAEAAEGLGPRPTIQNDEKAEVDRLNREISDLSAKRAKATKDLGPKGAAIQAKNFDDQIAQRNAQVTTIMGQVASRQSAYDERLAEFAKQTGPFATREPGLNAAMSAAPAASAASGAILGGLAGRTISPLKRAMTYAAAGLGGGLEGLIGGYYPTFADLHMPEGSVAKTQADLREENPAFWKHGVLPEVGMSAATGLLGAKYGMLRRTPKMNSLPTLPAPAAEDIAALSKTPKKNWPSDYRQINMAKDKNGNWFEQGTGHKIPKELWPPAGGAPAGTMLNAPETRAGGGTVHGYQDGGSPYGISEQSPFDARFSGAYPFDTHQFLGPPLGNDPHNGYLPNRTAAFAMGQKYPLSSVDPASLPGGFNPARSSSPDETGTMMGLPLYPRDDPMPAAATTPATGRPDRDIAPEPDSRDPIMPRGDRQLPPSVSAFDSPQPTQQPRSQSLAQSPWLALMAAGLGMMGGTSPYAAVNIGKGGLEGIKELGVQESAAQRERSIDQAAERLAQQAQFHQDQYTKSTPYQKFEMSKPYASGQVMDPNTGYPLTTYQRFDPEKGWIATNPLTGNVPSTDGSGATPPPNNATALANAIKDGTRPPTMTNVDRRTSTMTQAQLARDGFNLTRAQLEYDAAHKQVLSLNAPQMVRYTGLAGSVVNTIDEVNDLAKQMDNSGIPLANQVKLAAYIQLQGNSPKGQLAARYIGAVNTLKEEFANLANGGYAPTDAAWKLANEQINGNYGVQELGASLKEVQRLIRYRINAIPNLGSLGPGAENRYVPGTATTPPAGEPVPSAPKVGERKQFKQGWGIWNGTTYVPETP